VLGGDSEAAVAWFHELHVAEGPSDQRYRPVERSVDEQLCVWRVVQGPGQSMHSADRHRLIQE
jgi:hypothetical protein